VGDYRVEAAPSQVTDVVNAIRAKGNQQVDFTLLRSGQTIVIPCTPDVSLRLRQLPLLLRGRRRGCWPPLAPN
jgi:hypothetical protein